MSRCRFIIKSTFFLDYLIAFGYFAQLEVLYHLLYVISSTLKEWSQACFHNLRPWLHYCPKKVKKENVTITTANSDFICFGRKCHSKYGTLHPGTVPECADNLQLLRHPFLQDKCNLPRYALRQDELELPHKAMNNIIRSHTVKESQKRVKWVRWKLISYQREKLCVSPEQTFYKRYYGGKERKIQDKKMWTNSKKKM